eukprot:gene2530-biopygen5702
MDAHANAQIDFPSVLFRLIAVRHAAERRGGGGGEARVLSIAYRRGRPAELPAARGAQAEPGGGCGTADQPPLPAERVLRDGDELRVAEDVEAH